MSSKRKIVRDYYRVNLSDMFADGWAPERLAEIAIDEARERARLYCSPAEWRAEPLGGGMFRVYRLRYARKTPRPEGRNA